MDVYHIRFPGSPAAYEALTECVDADLLAEAAVFVSTQPHTANQMFNCSNGDVFRWSEVGPGGRGCLGRVGGGEKWQLLWFC